MDEPTNIERLKRLHTTGLDEYATALRQFALFSPTLSHFAAPTSRQHQPATYSGVSRSTKFAHAADQKLHDTKFSAHPKITSFFPKAPQAFVDPDTSDSEDEELNESSPVNKSRWNPSKQELDELVARVEDLQVEKLHGRNEAVAKSANKRHTGGLTEYDKLRYLSILRFFQLLLKGVSQMDASLAISNIIFNAGLYRATAIRDWAKQFRISNQLDSYKQGSVQAGTPSSKRSLTTRP